MTVWLFSSKNLDNIMVASQRLLWGFWDREAGEKQRRNWRDFIRLFNRIKPFDFAVFQIAKTGEIHALGVVKRTYYDDQTRIWQIEIDNNRVYFPWRVEFSILIFSKEPFLTYFVRVEKYVDGYGLGEVPLHEFRLILDSINNRLAEIGAVINMREDTRN